MIFRPAESSKKIVEFYRNYLLTTFQTNNDSYNKQLEEQLCKDKTLSTGPYISLNDVFDKGETLSELVNQNILSNDILNFKELHPNRNLYKHQDEAIKKYSKGANLIITTGTGSGKTECFLIPLLNSLLQEKENHTLGSGVRTLIVYPMNALVNDQIRRLREIFSDTSKSGITFGRFTGETKEYYNDALKDYIAREGSDPIEGELISREEMRDNPPNILITNYAMLEYLLLRPGDNVFFNSNNATKWKSIVFDEAHTYSGAKGIEVSNLVKRLKARLRRNDIQFILTSATLGNDETNSQIIDFAQALCSTKFTADSIIRAKRIAPPKVQNTIEVNMSFYRELSQKLKDNYDAKSILGFINGSGYCTQLIPDKISENFFNETIYHLILHDKFYYTIRRALLNQTKSLSELSKELNVEQNDLTDFIAVASHGQKNGDRIFEARYHMFIRGLEGIFVTLKPSDKLFIIKMETFTDNPFDETDIGYKCFEIAFCHNCNAIFITGQTNSKGFFEQKSKFSDEYQPEVYLLDGDYEATDDESENEKEYLICSKCGKIKRASSVNGLDCGHDKVYYNKLIKVKDKGGALHSCPCCHAINTQRSIVRPYFLGNEAATAVIATGLYNELPHSKVSYREVEIDDYFGGASKTIEKEVEKLSKQFLAFSDNRQAAAFFASYLENTYRDNLVKRIMTKVCQDDNLLFEKGISLISFVEKFEAELAQNKIYNHDNRHKKAWISVVKEIINFKAKNSLQNKGILYFDCNIPVPNKGAFDLSPQDTVTLFKILVKDFIKVGAIQLPLDLTRAEEQELTFNGITKGFLETKSNKSYIDAWLPLEGKENKRTKALKKLFPQKSNDEIFKLLKSVWGYLCSQNAISYYNDKYLLNHEYIVVKKVSDLYKCTECKTITPYSINNICTNHKCLGKLEEYNVPNDHYRNLFTTLDIDDLIAKEHTAQLGSNKAYDYQNEFKNKTINVLSCSTTFEMGVDVGSLNTVFMRNMPPTPANYAQRAGRAGRSLQSAAYSITFCPNNSHDLNYFNEPTAMIKGVVNPPTFNTQNPKILQRHIFASAFSFFWNANIVLYKTKIGEFFDADGYNLFKKYLESKPYNLKDYLHSIVVSPDLKTDFGIDDYLWISRLFSEDENAMGVFTIAYNRYNRDMESLKNAENQCQQELRKCDIKDRNSINFKMISINNSIRTLRDQNIIEYLSRNNLIPKYGFPVDTVELQNFNPQNNIGNNLRLDRDLFSAISEYAPSSEIVADGKLITSRYVKKLNGYEWPKYVYAVCDSCNTLNRVKWPESLPEECKQCGSHLENKSNYIIPSFGFVMGFENDGELSKHDDIRNVGNDKPERTYKGAISYIGNENEIDFHNYNVCGKVIAIGSSKMDQLAVINDSSFYVCETCGYSIIDDKHPPYKSVKHRKSDGYPCLNTNLVPHALGHEFQTDVCLIKFTEENITDIEHAWTILYALIEGVCKHLNVDRTEISGCLHWYKNNGIGNYSFVLFDNTPGGAGYVRQITNPNCLKGIIELANKTVTNCVCGGETKDTACYACLCNYYNQKQHNILKRIYAIDFFKSVLSDEECEVELLD